MGVEEEFLIVDGESGNPLPLGEVLEQLSDFPRLTSEMKQEQIETCTLPRVTLAELADDISVGRNSADAAAKRAGASAVALATSPLPVESTIAPGERCARLMERFGLTAVEQLTGGCHVHVEIESEEEGVAILDRIRIWLPVLLAISANSPYWNGVDSSYASYRWQAWTRWPTTGAADIYGSAAAYHHEIGQILGSGVPLDKANLYFDARLSHKHPTIEVRVADVCLVCRRYRPAGSPGPRPRENRSTAVAQRRQASPDFNQPTPTSVLAGQPLRAGRRIGRPANRKTPGRIRGGDGSAGPPPSGAQGTGRV